jgi:hypothetical protein
MPTTIIEILQTNPTIINQVDDMLNMLQVTGVDAVPTTITLETYIAIENIMNLDYSQLHNFRNENINVNYFSVFPPEYLFSEYSRLLTQDYTNAITLLKTTKYLLENKNKSHTISYNLKKGILNRAVNKHFIIIEKIKQLLPPQR